MVSNFNYLKLCREAFKAASDATADLAGTTAAGEILCMGADGTPTTRIDLAAEDAILEILNADGRSMRVISEEMGEKILGDSPEFSLILDPLDGTYNSVSGIPFYSTSIAAATPDLSKITFGYVSNLAIPEEYYAEIGKGAFLNGKAIRVSHNSDLKKLCISAYGYRQNVERTGRLYNSVRRVRVLGSVALEICYVAAGRLDAFVDVRSALRLTDVAAGKVVLSEAGGIVTDERGMPIKLPLNVISRVDMVASNVYAHKKLLKLLSRG